MGYQEASAASGRDISYHSHDMESEHIRFISSHQQLRYALLYIIHFTSHISCHLKQGPQYSMLRLPALTREYPQFCFNLEIKIKTISQAYTTKW